MVHAIRNNPGNTTRAKKAPAFIINNISDLKLEHFVTKNTLFFFEKLQLSVEFMDDAVDNWENNKSYINGLLIVKNLQIVNDVAERGVALITSYNSSATKDEEQKQYLLQVVADHRKNLPHITKSKLFKSDLS